MKRLRRDYKKRFASAAMAATMLATMLPFSAVAYAVGGIEEPKDISITWGTPSTTTDEAGTTTGSVTLSASLKEDSTVKSATVEIKLDAEEAEALTNEDVLTAAGITLKDPEPEEPTPKPEQSGQPELLGQPEQSEQPGQQEQPEQSEQPGQDVYKRQL